MTATRSSTIPLSVEKLKEYAFTLFHHLFRKRTIFEGTFGTIGPKGAFGSKKNVAEEIFQREGHLAISQETLCSLLFQICLLQPKQFKILPLDGGPQQLVCVKLRYFHLGQRFQKLVDRNIYCPIYLISLKLNRYPDLCFSKQYITFEKSFSQFYNKGL